MMRAMRPNLIFILADDLGGADLGCYGGHMSAGVSPVLDRMAAEGMKFERGYSNSAVCSPTRFAAITGRWQYRLRGAAEEPLGRLAGDKLLGLPPEHPTLPSLLAGAGYATALFGKWHLGYPPQFGPRKSGYSSFFGVHSGAADYFSHRVAGKHDLWDNETEVFEEGYLTDLISRRAVNFLRERQAGQPFLMSVHYTAPHWPWETREDRAESLRIGDAIRHADGGSLATYRKMIHHMDEGIGWILAELEAQGLAEETLVVFTSDNGGERFSDNWPFSGGKMDLTEGGIRVPLIARWPGRIAPASVSATPAITMDWAATMLAAAGVAPDPEHPLDGIDLAPLFADPAWNPGRDLGWRMKHRSQAALLRGSMKYLRVDGHEYLFDVATDPRERANLALRQPEVLATLRQAWTDWDRGLPPIPVDAGVILATTEQDFPRATH
ncbi:MAG: N-acetylgalactosamine-6-sulfatase [Ramlibacter sp.]|jgi:arylsulfatase A-like enzyme|nr:N-acetylgalactosamine-6-sulfatase [Ramlibacter sp.]